MTEEKQLQVASKTKSSVLDATGSQTSSVISSPSKPNSSYPLFVAKYDFASDKDGDLNFKKVDQLYVINKDNKNWWFARAQHSGQEGYIPSNHVADFLEAQE